MKASHGGMLHTLFDYSHPVLLGGKTHPHRSRSPGGTSSISTNSTAASSSRGDGGDGDGDGDVDGDSATTAVSCTISSSRGDGRQGMATRGALGRRLPRCLVVHGTADATVPFSQTAAVAAALKTLGVPTVVRYDPGGEMHKESER